MTQASTAATVEHLETLVPSWLRHLKAENKAASTIKNYTESALKLGEFLAANGMPVEVSKIHREHVEAFIVSIMEGGASASTAATRYRGLQQFFGWCLDEGEIQSSPMERMKPPKLEEREVPVVSEADLRALLKAADGSEFVDRRDTAILRLFLNSGARLAELAGLRVDDVDLDREEIRVLRKGNRYQALHVTGRALKALDRYYRLRRRHSKAHDSWFWLGPKGRLTSSGIAQMLRRRCQEAGIDFLHPHQLRHTWAHTMKINGASDEDLMYLGGWRSQQMVARYGASAVGDRAKGTLARIAPGDDL